MHISKAGDPYLRTMLVQGAHYILGLFGEDSDLRRWGLKLERQSLNKECGRKGGDRGGSARMEGTTGGKNKST
jgi:transposase